MRWLGKHNRKSRQFADLLALASGLASLAFPVVVNAGPPRLCAALLASQVDDGTAEAKIADAWADLLTQGHTLSEDEAAWLAEVAGGADPFAPGEGFFNPADLDGLQQLQGVVSTLAEAGQIKLSELRRQIISRAQALIGETNTARETETRAQDVRSTPTAPVIILEGHSGPVRLASFSPDGSKIVTASGDSTARVWDLSGNLLATLSGHATPVLSAAFSPDGTQIVTASWDRTARIWDLSGNLIAILGGHADWVNFAAFSPDGSKIVTASADKTARIWYLELILEDQDLGSKRGGGGNP